MYKYITLSRPVVALGQPVSGLIGIEAKKSMPANFSVRCVCSVEGRAGSATKIIVTNELNTDPSLDKIPFFLDLPSSAPVSYDGKLFRVIWKVMVGNRGFFGGKVMEAPFLVVPRRSPLLNS